MKLCFLGTGAADWKADKHRNTEGYRRNSSLLLDDCLLIDPGPDVGDALASFQKKKESIRYILNTHRHGDHRSEGTLALLAPTKLTPMAAGESKTLGPYTVTALRANHATCTDAVHFLISDGEKTIFYGLDGAWLLYEEVAAIKKQTVDLAVLDATVGNTPGDYRIFEHNDLDMVIRMKAALSPYVKRFVISHMARTLHASHPVLSAQMKFHDIEVAYDGLEIQL